MRKDRKNSWQCAWRCVAMRDDAHQVKYCVPCRVKKFYEVSRFVTATTLWSTHAWDWMSRISRTVRNLCVTHGTTRRKLYASPWQTPCHQNGTTWHGILRRIAPRRQNSCQCEACFRTMLLCYENVMLFGTIHVSLSSSSKLRLNFNTFNQSINQKRIKVTKVTNVTARPLLQC